MRKLTNLILSKIKGRTFEIDKDIPLMYLISLIINRGIMLIRGSLTFCKHGSFFFRDKKTTLKCKSKIRLGKGVTIARNCYIDALSREGIILGNHVSIGKNTTIECSGTLVNIGKGLKVGNGVGLGTHGFFGCAGGIEIGENTIFGNYVSMHSENHNYNDKNKPIKDQGINRKGIKIGVNCWIGAKATILDGVIIENGCIIAAGALVLEGTYTENSIYGGVPAKFLKTRF
jgi:acetyltransferase-like isoleucine patch superfamily enzyme